MPDEALTVREYLNARAAAAPEPKPPSPQDRMTPDDRRAWLFRVRRASQETRAKRMAAAEMKGEVRQ